MRERNKRETGRSMLRILMLLLVAGVFCLQQPTGITAPRRGETNQAPRIGLLSTAPSVHTGDSSNTAPDGLQKYRDALASWGAIVVPIVLAASMPATLADLDGLLIPGGGDIDPMLYGERPHPRLEKVNRAFDEFELSVLKAASALEMPVLGICRGHQIMNVFRGGTLWQDIPSQTASESGIPHRIRKDGNSALCTHTIRLEPETIIAELLSSPTVDVNSYHHQSVKNPGDGLRITASSSDGIVEAIESTSGPFFVGVQFHPEKMLPDHAEFGRLFEMFVDAARRYRGVTQNLR